MSANDNQGRGPKPARTGFRDWVMALVYALCAGLLIYVWFGAAR